MGKRTDEILFLHGTIYVLEFKTGATSYDRSAIDQAVDYAVNLSNFHEGSHNRTMVPILIATRAGARQNQNSSTSNIWDCQFANQGSLKEVVQICDAAILRPNNEKDATIWAQSRYRPTPTIIEAAQALYRGHSVEEISRSEASAINLSTTANALPK